MDPSEPQTWNAYTYVANRPLLATDPLGLNGWEGKCEQEISDSGWNVIPRGCENSLAGRSIAARACGWYNTGPGPMRPCNPIAQSEAELSDPDLGEPGHEQPGGNYSWVQSDTVVSNSSNAFGFGGRGLRYDPGYWQWNPAPRRGRQSSIVNPES